jgi:hypothetical protein
MCPPRPDEAEKQRLIAALAAGVLAQRYACDPPSSARVSVLLDTIGGKGSRA